MRFILNKFPDDKNFNPDEDWTPLKESTNLWIIQLQAIPFMAINLVLVIMLMRLIGISFSFNSATMLISFLIFLQIHELIHALFFPVNLRSKNVFFGFMTKGFAPFAAYIRREHIGEPLKSSHKTISLNERFCTEKNIVMSKFCLCILLPSLAGLFACTQPPSTIQLQTGDILFRGATSGQLSEAIDKVTQTNEATHFSHVGLVEVSDTGIAVLHASPHGGTSVVSLEEFMHPEGDSVLVVAYRLKVEWQKAIPAALTKAKQMLGKPYNFSYIMSDSAHYCSEFVYLAFAADSVFKLEPMTFKDPKTGSFPPTWVEYYQKMEIEIPEGQSGCNPNGLAASNKLFRLGKITL